MKWYNSILQYILVISLVLDFCTPYMYIPGLLKVIHYSTFASLILLILLNKGYNSSIASFVLLLLFGALFPLINVAGSISMYIMLYMIMLPLSVIYIVGELNGGLNKLNLFFYKYSNVIAIIAVISLFFWVFGSVLEKIPYTFVIPNRWFGDRFIPTYYGIYFETQESSFGGDTSSISDLLIRNSGLFNEAPMYNMNLCFALSIECFLREKYNYPKILLFIITVLTTISTTGFLFLILLAFVQLFVFFRNRKNVLIKLLLIPLFLFAFSVVLAVLDNKRETGSDSFVNRGEDIERCIEVGLENPITGVGVLHAAKENSSKKTSFGFSNSLFTTFAHGGFYFAFLYVFALLIVPIIIFRRTKTKWPFFIFSYFFLFTFTLSLYWFLTIFIVSLGLVFWYKEICCQEKLFPVVRDR